MTIIDRIPAHIRYPGLVLMFLGGSIIGQVFLFRAAFSNGGPQVEENYYERAMGEAIVERGARISESRALGWSVTVKPEQEHVILDVCDANGSPLQMASGEVEVRRPHLAGRGGSIHGKEPFPIPMHRRSREARQCEPYIRYSCTYCMYILYSCSRLQYSTCQLYVGRQLRTSSLYSHSNLAI